MTNLDRTPFLSLWFGNFFEPFYSDADATRRAIADIAELGFTAINLDSKPWQDFFARYEGGPASQYVGMQELMMEEAARHGLDYTCLALYLCGDNLYPAIRDVPPVRGKEAVRPDGSPTGTYDYAAPEAQASMVAHVEGLLRLYGEGMHRTADGRVVMQTMFDPIAKPSFDPAGRSAYLGWLEDRYSGDIEALNVAYGLSAQGFAELSAEQYWLRPEELDWVSCALPTAHDLAERTPDFRRWVDNQTYLGEVMVEYFRVMREHWRATSPPLFAEPVLHQWGYFFNPPGQPDWQTGQRALDIYRVAEHVDSVLVIASPLDPENRPNAAALSAETSILRSANLGRPFTGGLYLGRHINEDVYRVVPPAEAIATTIAGGATRLHAYGYSGLDDGGVMFRMDEPFRASLRDGLRWAREVMPLIDQARDREAAILFPAQMSFYEPLELDVDGRHRMDLLGWYSQLVDLGWNVDVLHPDQVAAGALADYAILAIPTNSFDDLDEHGPLVAEVHAFAAGGGTVLHGPSSRVAQRAFAVEEREVPFDCLAWEEDVIPHGWSTTAFTHEAENLADYIGTGLPGLVRKRIGSGAVISFGFEYGYAYARRSMPIVPPQYGRREMHPVVLLRRTPVEALVGRAPRALLPTTRGLEIARFGDRAVVVNHRSSPIDVSRLAARRTIETTPSAPGWLAAHSAVYLELDS